jgi:hypothetical protein
VEEIQKAIQPEINIDTDIFLAMTAAVRKFLTENRTNLTPEWLKPAREAAKDQQRYVEFGCKGQASIRPQPAGHCSPVRQRRAVPPLIVFAAAGAASAPASPKWSAAATLPRQSGKAITRQYALFTSVFFYDHLHTPPLPAQICWRAAKCATTTPWALTEG